MILGSMSDIGKTHNPEVCQIVKKLLIVIIGGLRVHNWCKQLKRYRWNIFALQAFLNTAICRFMGFDSSHLK